MKKISSILILVLISTFSSCNDDNTEIQNPSQNGFTLNSEFFNTKELYLGGTPGEIFFFIIEDIPGFNNDTGAFEGDLGQLITFAVPIELFNGEDFVHTYTNAVQENAEEVTGDSFVAALLRDVPSITSFYVGNSGASTETLLIGNTGEVTVGFDSETLIFTLDYTFTTNSGTITGFHESEFIEFN